MECKMCSICLENLTENIIIEFDCNHPFHPKCIFEWVIVNDTCPMCRKEINGKIVEEEIVRELLDHETLEDDIIDLKTRIIPNLKVDVNMFFLCDLVRQQQSMTPEVLIKKSRKELLVMCKEKQIRRYSSLNKQGLVNLLASRL